MLWNYRKDVLADRIDIFFFFSNIFFRNFHISSFGAFSLIGLFFCILSFFLAKYYWGPACRANIQRSCSIHPCQAHEKYPVVYVPWWWEVRWMRSIGFPAGQWAAILQAASRAGAELGPAGGKGACPSCPWGWVSQESRWSWGHNTEI